MLVCTSVFEKAIIFLGQKECPRGDISKHLFGLSPLLPRYPRTMATNRTEFNCRGLRKHRIHMCAAGDEIVLLQQENSHSSATRYSREKEHRQVHSYVSKNIRDNSSEETNYFLHFISQNEILCTSQNHVRNKRWQGSCKLRTTREF